MGACTCIHASYMLRLHVHSHVQMYTDCVCEWTSGPMCVMCVCVCVCVFVVRDNYSSWGHLLHLLYLLLLANYLVPLSSFVSVVF